MSLTRLGCVVVLAFAACSVAVSNTRVVCPEPERTAVGGEPSR